MRTILILTRVVGAALLLAATTAGCGGDDDGSSRAGDRPRLVVTTSVWGDVVRQIVGDAAEVDVLMPPGADPHSFRPSPRDVQRLLEADLVIANGLGLEASVSDALNQAFRGGVLVVRVGEDADPRPLDGTQHGDGEHGDLEEIAPEAMDHLVETGSLPDDHSLDPHVWLDPVRTAGVVRDLGDLLSELPALDGGPVRAAARQYEQAVLRTHERVEQVLDPIPPGDRLLVTSHDALGYFAERYGFDLVGVVIPGGSTQGEPSAAAIAALADEVRRRGVPAVFTDEGESDRVAQALAAEVGAVQVVPLYTGELGSEGSGAGTYLEMIETNARRIAAALTADG